MLRGELGASNITVLGTQEGAVNINRLNYITDTKTLNVFKALNKGRVLLQDGFSLFCGCPLVATCMLWCRCAASS